MYAIYGRVNPIETCELPDEDRDQLIDRAIAIGNEFAIIFTAACLREYALYPRPASLAAAGMRWSGWRRHRRDLGTSDNHRQSRQTGRGCYPDAAVGVYQSER